MRDCDSAEAVPFDEQCDRIFHEWDAAARAGDTEAMLALYADDAVFETALVPVVYPEKADGVLRGKAELRQFFERSSATRPDAMLLWHRSGRWLSDRRRMLAWEYPRETPHGEQIDVAEFFEIEGGRIARHRVYWGCKGVFAIAPAFARRIAQDHSSQPEWEQG